MDCNDHLSIKNLLFTKAIPNYVIPVPTTGHIVYACTDCGDKFIFASSYDYHINRKSVKISYFCRHCNVSKVFYNRCNLLSHIRSHAFKTATINVSDLKLDPLPINFFKKINKGDNQILTGGTNTISLSNETTSKQNDQNKPKLHCSECKTGLNFSQNGVNTMNEIRAKHYMQYSGETYTCPLCLFSFPSKCALKTHLRIHFKLPPYFCPECGKQLTNLNTKYPYHHICESFLMMRSTARLKCPVPDCHLFHPSDFKDHIKENHLKKVHKCPYCYVACFDEEIMTKHLKNHTEENKKSLKFYQCEMCPGKLVLNSQLENHLNGHTNKSCYYMFPCWVCAKIFKDMFTLATHHMNTHFMREPIKSCFQQLLQNLTLRKKDTNKKIYRVIKKCDQCKRSFSYKCDFGQINNLPNECPYKCTASSGPVMSAISETQIEQNTSKDELLTCHMCKNKISQDWTEIKKHFAEFHKTHRCVDIQVKIARINIEKYSQTKRNSTLRNQFKKTRTTKKCVKKKTVINNTHNNTEDLLIPRENEFLCRICFQECNSKQILQDHLLTHRDPCMSYQCLECGQSFVVKPSFAKHLLLEHNISDTDNYICEKPCYNESALMKYQDINAVHNEPLRENQCKICREIFEASEDLEKHFRVHGMAFLMKNNTCKSSSP